MFLKVGFQLFVAAHVLRLEGLRSSRSRGCSGAQGRQQEGRPPPSTRPCLRAGSLWDGFSGSLRRLMWRFVGGVSGSVEEVEVFLTQPGDWPIDF